MDYGTFLASKRQLAGEYGFEPVWLPEFLFDFQRHLVAWAIRKGRAAIFADCGLGKTPMQLVWAENVVRRTGRAVLLLTPLAVGPQMAAEAERFGVDAVRYTGGTLPGGARVVICNYEKLHLLDPAAFDGVACDESGILKNFDGVRRSQIIEFLRTRRYRLLATATAAPNDFIELGNSSEALGEMGFADMLTMFFRRCSGDVYAGGWGRSTYRLRSHAERDFWRWVCSWARAIRKPSDIGGDDGPFALPRLITREHVIPCSVPRADVLFDLPPRDLHEQRAASRRSLSDRCTKAAALVADTGRPAVCWCHLNDEGDLLERLIQGAVQVSGTDSDERKEEVFAAFVAGQVRVLVTKPVLGGFGLNWQHCSRQTFFPSHSFEQWYQAIRRSWRFGQRDDVTVDMVASEVERGVLANLQRKAAQAEVLFSRLVELMSQSLAIRPGVQSTQKEIVPSWL